MNYFASYTPVFIKNKSDSFPKFKGLDFSYDLPSFEYKVPESIPLDSSDWRSQFNTPSLTYEYSNQKQDITKTTTYAVNPSLKDLSFMQMVEKYGDGIIRVGNTHLRGNVKYGAKNSWHKQPHPLWKNTDGTPMPQAFDLTPTKGHTFKDMWKTLAKPEWQYWLASNGWGAIDESTREIRNRHSWTATGDHIHVGKDSNGWNWNYIDSYQNAVKRNTGITIDSKENILKRKIDSAKQGGVLKAQYGMPLFASYDWFEYPHDNVITYEREDPIQYLHDLKIYNQNPQIHEDASDWRSKFKINQVGKNIHNYSSIQYNTSNELNKLKQDFGDLYDLTNKESDRLLTQDSLQRARQAVQYLMKYGLSKQAACASVGVFLSENGCNPSSYNKQEKNGGASSSLAANGGYGAGIGSWTGVQRKRKALQSIGKDPNKTRIEDLSLEEQCKIYASEILNGNTQTDNKLLNGNIEEASVAAMFKTHGDARQSLRKNGYTYKAALQEQKETTPKLMRFSHRSTPTPYHQTTLLTRILLANKLMNLV